MSKNMGLFTYNVFLSCLSIVSAFTAVFFAFFIWKFQYWKRRNVHYLEPTIPWGNFAMPLDSTKFMGEVVQENYQEAKTKGWKYCGIYTLYQPNLLVVDLDLAKQILTKDFHNFVDRGFYTNEKDDPLSCTLFSIGGTKWRNLRTKISPTFTSGKLKSMFSTLVECGMVLEKYIESHIENDNGVDIKDVLGNFSTDIIGSCAFGLECNSFKDSNSPFRVYGRKIFAPSNFWRFMMPFVFPGIAAMFQLRTTPKDVSDFFIKVVKDTVTYREKNNYRRSDFLQLLIDVKNNKENEEAEHKGDGKTLTMEEIAAQCFVFFLAGFETSSATMTFALYELAINQDYQDKVREEINTVLAKHNGEMTYDSLSELKYMKQVIDETLRKYPPLSVVTRVAEEDYKIPGEDAIVEKGIKVIVPIQGIHYDPEYYENPKVFDPDRFSEENKEQRHPYAHIPFGEGPRICVGERFGIMQTKVGLTSILKNFKVTLNKKTQLPLQFAGMSLSARAKGGIWINLEKVQPVI